MPDFDIHVTPMDFGKSAVTVLGVSKSFGESVVLDNVHFSVDEDEIVVLLGASGNARFGYGGPAWKKCDRASRS
jgi:ATPase subunit of ABC transporter with duplicated ATPase domains